MWFPYTSAFARIEGECTHLRTQKGEFVVRGVNTILWNILHLADGTRSVDQIKTALGPQDDPDGLTRLICVLRSIAAITPANRRYEAFHHATDNPNIAPPEVTPDRVTAYTRNTPRRRWIGQRIFLTAPEGSLASLLRARQSTRTFSPLQIGIQNLGAILWSCQGTTGRAISVSKARTTPSGGGLFPLQLFVWSSRVKGLSHGVFAWEPEGYLISRGSVETTSIESCLVDHIYAQNAAAIVLITGDIPRSVRKYGDRGYRYVLLEAGHACQNAILAATELGVGSLVLGGFLESATRRVFRVPRILQPLIMIVLGAP